MQLKRESSKSISGKTLNHEFELCALGCVCNHVERGFYSTPSATSPVDTREKLVDKIHQETEDGTCEHGNQNTKVLSVKAKKSFRGVRILFCVGS